MNSQIDILIKQPCPNGVEKVKLGEVCTCITGGDTPEDCVKGQKEPSKEYPYPVYANGDEIYGYASHYRIDKPAVTISSIGNVGTAYYREPYFTPIIRLKTFIPNDESLDVKFLYYCLSVMSFIGTNSSLSSMKAADFKKREIPLPPLAIQQEIVKILDKFTSLIDKIDEEINLRQKQYEYYREKLLTFEEGECEWKKISEIAEFNRGKRVVRKDLDEVGTIPVYQNSLTPLGYSKEANYPERTTFVISAGAAGEVGYSEIPMWAADDCLTFEQNKNLDSKYIYHFLKTKETYLKSQIRGGAIKRLSREILERLEIPVPSKSQQQTIVQTLDKFETLIGKLKEERTLRQKQYEYYREKLLTF